MEFIWLKSEDPDNDAVTYRLTYCTNQNFTGCSPVDVTPNSTVSLYPESLGMLIFGMTLIGGLSRRRAFVSVFVIIVLFGCVSLMSCKQNSGTFNAEEIGFTATGLPSGNTYYWKVVADDMKGGITQSAVWSFST